MMTLVTEAHRQQYKDQGFFILEKVGIHTVDIEL